jgi:GT2 family glycosyltransferase
MTRAIDAIAASQAALPIVAFVVPVRDDADRLHTCLRSLQRAASANPHDVLVLDHGSRDRSGEVAREVGARVLTRHGGNVAALRNLGAAETTAPLIAFVDADNEVAAGWLDSAIAAFADPTVGIAGAPYSAPPNGTWVQRTYDALRRHPAADEPTEWLGAGNMVVRRDAFEQVGGFDDRLETCEDVDLCARMAAAGWSVRAVRGMQSVHHGDPSRLSNVFWGELWRGRDNLRVTLRGPRSVRTLASAAMPIAYAGAVVAAVFGGLAPRPIGPLLIAAGLTGLVGLAAVRVAAMRRNAGGRLPAGLWAALKVAVAYDLGRSAAVFVGVGHGRRRGADRQ